MVLNDVKNRESKSAAWIFFGLIFLAFLYYYFSIFMDSNAAAINKFKIGDRVVVNVPALNVRAEGSTAAAVLGSQALGASGTVGAGPKSANGYIWWQINYDQGMDGWSADRYLNLSSKAETGLPKPAAKSLLWGAYVGSEPDDLASFEGLAGKKVNIRAIFIGWNDGFPREVASALEPGQILLIFWEPYMTSLDSINAGQSDKYMKEFAAAAKDYGGPIILAPFHEMNGNWDPWDGYDSNDERLNSPATIISAWRRVHGAFSGAKNVKFGWAVNNVSVPDIPENAAQVYYPGDSYVDYVGVDGFNFGDPWQSFSQVFDESLASLAAYKKPIYIFSTGAIAAKQKAAWIKDGLGSRVKEYKNLAGWVWFNQNGADGNWLINSDPASLTAFRAALP